MSAIVILQQSDAIHFITDGAIYSEDGTVLELQSKVTAIPLTGCAFAMRGPTWPRAAIAATLGLCSSFDEMADILPAIMNGMTGMFDVTFGGAMSPHKRNFEVVLAGWSDRAQRMVAGVALTWDAGDLTDPTGFSRCDGYEPGVLFSPGQGVTIPPIDIQATLGRTFEGQTDIDAIDPERDGFALHEAQRRAPGIYCGNAAYIIGGFAELTTVRRDGVQSRIIHEWPDRIGEKITPAGAAPVATVQAAIDALKAMEDAQRAALEREEAMGAGSTSLAA